MKPDTILWKSGCVKRWHSNIDKNLRESGDTTGEHSHRVAMLLLMLHPLPSAHLLSCALTHDTAEVFTGDVHGPMKQGYLKNLMESYEDQIAERFDLPRPSDKDKAWLTMCDKLDAVLWVREHAQHLLFTPEWIDEWDRVVTIATTLGVKDKLDELVSNNYAFKAERSDA